VGRASVQQLLGAAHAYEDSVALLICTSDFTDSARDFATRQSPRIRLWTLQELERFAERRLPFHHIDDLLTIVSTSPVVQRPIIHEVNRSVEFYDKVAGLYDHGVSQDFIQTHLELNRIIRTRLSATGENRLLDLGGGTGRLASAFQDSPRIHWHYCDASSRMAAIFHQTYRHNPVFAECVCSDAEEYLQKDNRRYDIILMSFLLSSMPDIPDFSLLRRRLTEGGLIVVAEANPAYSETKPNFSVADRQTGAVYSLRIRPIDAPTLARRAALAELNIVDLFGYDKGNRPYSYIATFQKTQD
jgi:ubiquinone/menaquinone biosynthesis C-methylase UbiE